MPAPEVHRRYRAPSAAGPPTHPFRLAPATARVRHHATGPIRPGSVAPMTSVLGQGDPTGLSSPLGQLVVLAGLLASLTLLLRWWWQNRRH